MPRRARRYMGSDVTSWPLKRTRPSLGVIWPVVMRKAGGLAGSVGTEQADHLAGIDLEIDAIHDAAAAIILDETPHFQNGHARSS